MVYFITMLHLYIVAQSGNYTLTTNEAMGHHMTEHVTAPSFYSITDW